MSESAFVIDRDEVFAAGLKYLLVENFGFEIAGFSRSGIAAEHRIRTTAPSIVFIDPLGMTQETLALCEHIRQWSEQPKIAVISEALSGPGQNTWFSQGLSAYILKPMTLSDLTDAICAIRSSRPFESPDLGAANKNWRSRPVNDPLADLSAREQQIFIRTVNGRSSGQIAAEFDISIKTAEWHRRNVLTKIGVPNIALLTKFAIREGLTGLD